MDETTRQKMIDMGMFPTSREKPKVVKLADFNLSAVKFIDFYDWVNVAYYFDPRELIKDMPDILSARRIDIWFSNRIDYWKSNKKWDLDVARLIVVLYLHHQELRFISGGLDYDLINSLLIEIAEQTNNEYKPREEDKKWVEKRNREEVSATFRIVSTPSDNN